MQRHITATITGELADFRCSRCNQRILFQGNELVKRFMVSIVSIAERWPSEHKNCPLVKPKEHRPQSIPKQLTENLTGRRLDMFNALRDFFYENKQIRITVAELDKLPQFDSWTNHQKRQILQDLANLDYLEVRSRGLGNKQILSYTIAEKAINRWEGEKA